MIGKVLVIAGSDSGGGAGIQADIKTINSIGAYCSTAITALTAQNTLGVQDVLDIPSDFVGSQIDSVLSDIGTDIIKIGMLSNETIINAVSEKIDGYRVVLDPVMIAKGGASLLNQNAISSLNTKLIPKAYLVTPNIPEAEVLTGMKIKSPEDMEQAAKTIKDLGAENILVKGGHLEGNELIDILLTTDGIKKFNGLRINTNNTHGTGCTLASAISAYLAMGNDLEQAVENSIAYVREAITNAPDIGSGHGPLNHQNLSRMA